MVLAAEHVDHRYGGVCRQLLDHLVRARADPDRLHVAREDERGVPDRLAARELEIVRLEHHQPPAELGHPHLERQARSRRGTLEQQRDALLDEGLGAVPVGLELERAVEGPQLVGRKLVPGPGKWRVPLGIVIAALTWNLAHGRDFPPDPVLADPALADPARPERGGGFIQVNQPLRRQFIAWLALQEWEIALLQEGSSQVAERPGSRHGGGRRDRAYLAQLVHPVARAGRRAQPRPDRLERGGSNQILVRAPARIRQMRRLTSTQETRQLADALNIYIEIRGGHRLAAANLHATSDDRAASARRWRPQPSAPWTGPATCRWCSAATSTCGRARTPERSSGGCASASACEADRPGSLDHVLGRGLEVVRRPARLDRDIPGPEGLRIRRLSDHAPVVASFGMK